MSSDDETLTSVVQEVQQQRSKRTNKMKKKKKPKAIDSDSEHNLDVETLVEKLTLYETMTTKMSEQLQKNTEIISKLSDNLNDVSQKLNEVLLSTERNSSKNEEKSSSSSEDESSTKKKKTRKPRKPQPKNGWIMFQSTNKQKITDFLKENEDDEMFEGITDGRKRRQLATKHLWEQMSKEDHQHYKKMGIELFATEHPDVSSDKSSNSDNEEASDTEQMSEEEVDSE